MRGALLLTIVLGALPALIALPTTPRSLAEDGHDHASSGTDDEIHVEMTVSGAVADYANDVAAIKKIFETKIGEPDEHKVSISFEAGSPVTLEAHVMTKHPDEVEKALADVVASNSAAQTFIQTAKAGVTVSKVSIQHIKADGTKEAAKVGAADPCFPSRAVVALADGTPTRMDALKEGDEIIAADADGKLTTDTVSLLSLAKPSASGKKFVTLSTASGTSLSLTDGHYVPFGAACCSMLKKAKDVQVGDQIWEAGAKAAPKAVTVTAKSTVTLDGLHSPVLTHGGFPVVDGVVTAFDDAQTVSLAARTLKYLLPLCKATGSCNLFRRTFLNADRQYIDEA